MPAQTEVVQLCSNVREQTPSALQTAYNLQLPYEDCTGADAQTREEQAAARIGCYLASLARQDTVVVSAGPCSSRVVTRVGSLGNEVVTVMQGF